MKTILTILFTIFTFSVIAQNFSTINIVNTFPRDYTFYIYLNDQLAGMLKKNENLEYKIYSEGRISVRIVLGENRITESIDIKKGNTYYYRLSIINIANISFKLVDEEKGKIIYAKNTNLIKAEEDKKHPLGKLPDEVESDGPKQGTCFLISKQGYLLTNYHVIKGAKTIQVKGIGNDFTTLYAADVVAYDIDLDLALLKLKNQNLTFEIIPYGLSTETNSQGTKSFVLGFPMTTTMGEEIKVTEGIISAKSGFKGTISQYQFSAAVQPGNSGSPLFNENGDVIGIINAKLQGAEATGYAIKSQYVSSFLKLVESITIENNKTITANLSLTDKIAKLKNYIFIVICE